MSMILYSAAAPEGARVANVTVDDGRELRNVPVRYGMAHFEIEDTGTRATCQVFDAATGQPHPLRFPIPTYKEN